MCVCSVAQLCLTLYNPMKPDRLLCPWGFPDKDTGAGCHFLLQGSYWSRDRTCISSNSCIVRQILCYWTTWEARYPTNAWEIGENSHKNATELILALGKVAKRRCETPWFQSLNSSLPVPIRGSISKPSSSPSCFQLNKDPLAMG